MTVASLLRVWPGDSGHNVSRSGLAKHCELAPTPGNGFAYARRTFLSRGVIDAVSNHECCLLANGLREDGVKPTVAVAGDLRLNAESPPGQPSTKALRYRAEQALS